MENNDSANGGLVYAENKDVTNVTAEEISKKLNLPNGDLILDDMEIMMQKPRMPAQKKLKISRHGHIQKLAQPAGGE